MTPIAMMIPKATMTPLMTVSFVVPGAPAPKPVGPPKRGSTGFRAYQAYRDAIGWACRSKHTGEWLQGPLRLSCLFGLPIPRSWSESQKGAALCLRAFPTSKPDLKNLIAAVEDSLSGVLWSDDSRIVVYGDMLKCFRTAPSTYIEVAAMRAEDLGRHLLKSGRVLRLQTHRLMMGLEPDNAQDRAAEDVAHSSHEPKAPKCARASNSGESGDRQPPPISGVTAGRDRPLSGSPDDSFPEPDGSQPCQTGPKKEQNYPQDIHRRPPSGPDEDDCI